MGMAIWLWVILYIRESLLSILRWSSLRQCRDWFPACARHSSTHVFYLTSQSLSIFIICFMKFGEIFFLVGAYVNKSYKHWLKTNSTIKQAGSLQYCYNIYSEEKDGWLLFSYYIFTCHPFQTEFKPWLLQKPPRVGLHICCNQSKISPRIGMLTLLFTLMTI